MLWSKIPQHRLACDAWARLHKKETRDALYLQARHHGNLDPTHILILLASGEAHSAGLTYSPGI